MGWRQEGHLVIKAGHKCFMAKTFHSISDSSHQLHLWVGGANKVMEKRAKQGGSRGSVMTVVGKALVETNRPDVDTQKPLWSLRFATLNVGSLVGHSSEVVNMLERRKIDVACVQEVRYKNNSAKTFRGEMCDYKLFWSGDQSGSGGVGVFVKTSLCDKVVEVRRVNARLVAVDFVFGDKVYAIISVYALQCGRPDEEKDAFYDMLTSEVFGRKDCLILGDFNGHVGELVTGYSGVHGGFSYGDRNNEGERVLDFADSLGYRVMNTYFKKDVEKLVTYESGGNRTIIDYVLVNTDSKIRVKDVKAIPGEETLTQHRLLVMDASFCAVEEKRKAMKKVRLWRLKEPSVKRQIAEIMKEKSSEWRNWDDANEAMKDAVKKVCVVTKCGRRNIQWWWNEEEVCSATREKRKAFEKWRNTRSVEDQERYQIVKKETKRVIAKAIDKEAKEQLRKFVEMPLSERVRG